MKLVKNETLKHWIKALCITLGISGMLFANVAYAADDQDIGSVADNLKSTFTSLAEMITAASYIAGLGFAIGAILKFKAHKDNPQQIPVGTPIALMFVAAALIFLPSMFEVAGNTLFGAGNAISAGVEGTTDI